MMDFFPSNYMLGTPTENHHQPPSLNFHVQGLAPMIGKRSISFSEEAKDGEGEENLSDAEGAQAGEKKRRLNIEQVTTLENNFEMGSKLDLERKMQLAKALRLQPRQVAVWFQNRRARWKTKQLEKDYDTLKNQFDSLKNYNESLLAQNLKLQAEISALKGRESINLNKETDQGCSSNRSENSSDIKLDISTRTLIEKVSTLSSSHHQHPTMSRTFFPPSSSSSMITGPVDLHSHRFDQPIKEESFTNMLYVMDDQPAGFWPWVEPQQQHFN